MLHSHSSTDRPLTCNSRARARPRKTNQRTNRTRPVFFFCSRSPSTSLLLFAARAEAGRPAQDETHRERQEAAQELVLFVGGPHRPVPIHLQRVDVSKRVAGDRRPRVTHCFFDGRAKNAPSASSSSQASLNSANKPELCVDLNGATIEWASVKSSRKGVFQVTSSATRDDLRCDLDVFCFFFWLSFFR